MKKNRKKIDMVKAMKKKAMKKKRNRDNHRKTIPPLKILEQFTVDPSPHRVFGNVKHHTTIQWTVPKVLNVTRTDRNRHRLHIDWSGGHENGSTSYVQITRHGENNFEWYDEQTDFLRQDMKLDFLLWDHELHRDESLKQTILSLDY